MKATPRELMSNPNAYLIINDDPESPLARHFRGRPGQILTGIYVTRYDGMLEADRDYLDQAGGVRRTRSGANEVAFVEGRGRPASLTDGLSLVARVEALIFKEG